MCLPLGCGSIDPCNSFCPFQVRRQLAEWRFLKHSAIHRRRPLLQLPKFLPEDHPLSDTEYVKADESTLRVRSQYRQLGWYTGCIRLQIRNFTAKKKIIKKINQQKLLHTILIFSKPDKFQTDRFGLLQLTASFLQLGDKRYLKTVAKTGNVYIEASSRIKAIVFGKAALQMIKQTYNVIINWVNRNTNWELIEHYKVLTLMCNIQRCW